MTFDRNKTKPTIKEQFKALNSKIIALRAQAEELQEEANRIWTITDIQEDDEKASKLRDGLEDIANSIGELEED